MKVYVTEDLNHQSVLSPTSTFLRPKDDASCSSSRNEMGMRREEERLEWPVRESDRKNLTYDASQREKSSAGHCTERYSSIYHPNLVIAAQIERIPLNIQISQTSLQIDIVNLLSVDFLQYTFFSDHFTNFLRKGTNMKKYTLK